MTVRHWIVTHGLALNVAPDMDYFTYINPCGHAETTMTSMAQLISPCPRVEEVAGTFATCFAQLFERTITCTDDLAQVTAGLSVI